MTQSKSFKSTPQPLLDSSSLEKSSPKILKKGIQRLQSLGLRNQLLLAGLLGSILSFQAHLLPSFKDYPSISRSVYPPLAMAGGDPYIRALMRTISVSESNDPNPYGLLYGGTHFSEWENHPDRCIKIGSGPNEGNCSTAAGRYQFITSTWEEKAHQYHSNPEGWLFWRRYSFDPESQDQVLYRWLTDAEAWNMDISAQLKEGQIQTVLKNLSGTWTSLGYGIETNQMSPYLGEMYQKFLKEEQAKTGGNISRSTPVNQNLRHT
jgi:muramidase (phage lysozyme)